MTNKKKPCGECLEILKEEISNAYQRGLSERSKTGIDLLRENKEVKKEIISCVKDWLTINPKYRTKDKLIKSIKEL